ncbi:hypothetical protein Tco_0132716 [Tanacetum coccineum]
MELEKVVKERDELKVKIEKWEESSKGLNKILNSQMSAKDKNGLGYGTQLDEISNKSETDSEISMSVFENKSSDEEISPANDRFSKANGYHAVPPPITGNFLTPRADISFAGLDKYAIRKKIIESKTDTSKSKTSETVGKTNEVTIEKPKSVHESVVSKRKINRDKVIIEDSNSDDEDDVSAVKIVNPKICLQDHVVVDSGCSSHMTGNKAYLSDYEDYNGGFVDFRRLATLGGYVGEHVPLLPAMLAGVAEDQGEGSAIPAEPHHTPIDPIPSTSQPSIPSTTEPPHSSPPRSIDRQDTEVPQPQGPTITFVADEATTISVGVETEGAATTTSGLDAGMDSGNIHESPLRSHEAPLPEGNTSGSAEDSLQLKELMAIVPKMVTKIDSLEKELKETKQTLGHAVLTLVKKVKSLEMALKRMSKRVILSDSEDEETENQGRKIQDIDDDPLVSLVRNSMEEKEADFVTPKKVSASGEAQEEDISPTILEAAQILSQVVSQSVSTYKGRTRSANKGKDIGIGMDFFCAAKERLNSAKVEVNTEVNPGSAGVNTGNTPVSTPSVIQTVNVIVPSLVKSQREGKAPMTSEDVQATQKTKEQIRQEEAGLVEAMRLQALQDEEDARQVHIDALINKESSKKQKIAVEDVPVTEEKVEVVKKEEPIKRTGKRKKQKARKGTHADKTAKHEAEEDMEALVKGNDTDSSSGTDIPVSAVPVAIKPPSIANWKIIKLGNKGVYQIIREDGTYITYINFGAMLKSISKDDLTELYRLVMQKYGTNRPEDEVHYLTLESADIYMLTERRYPIPADVCQAMLDKKLQGDKKDEACYQFCNGVEKDCLSVGLPTTQQMVISSPCLTDIKNWLVQKQMAFSKDFLNPFIADSLLKTIWFSTHHASHAPCYSNEALAIPEQKATGKEISNPFMAGSLPKTT